MGRQLSANTRVQRGMREEDEEDEEAAQGGDTGRLWRTFYHVSVWDQREEEEKKTKKVQ